MLTTSRVISGRVKIKTYNFPSSITYRMAQILETSLKLHFPQFILQGMVSLNHSDSQSNQEELIE